MKNIPLSQREMDTARNDVIECVARRDQFIAESGRTLDEAKALEAPASLIKQYKLYRNMKCIVLEEKVSWIENTYHASVVDPSLEKPDTMKSLEIFYGSRELAQTVMCYMESVSDIAHRLFEFIDDGFNACEKAIPLKDGQVNQMFDPASYIESIIYRLDATNSARPSILDNADYIHVDFVAAARRIARACLAAVKAG